MSGEEYNILKSCLQKGIFMDYTALLATLTDYYMHKVAGSVEDLRVKVYEMHSDINIRASSISFSVSLFLLSLMAFFSLFLFLELFLPFTRFGIQTQSL